jgi:hypothetical protein
MRVVLSMILSRRALEPVGSRPEHATRRNVTLSPRRRTRVRAVPRADRAADASGSRIAA